MPIAAGEPGPRPAGHPPVERAASASCSSTSARPTPPAIGRCGATSRNSSPTRASSRCRAGMVADPQPDHPHACAPAARAATTPRSGTTSATRARSRPSRARRPRSSRALLGDDSASSSTGPCATPIPPPRARIAQLQAQGCDRILLVPLYPQYAAATTATACDEAFRALMRLRWQPAVRVAPAYYDDPVYIDALAASIARASGHARLRARGADRLLPRHAAAAISRRRPLPLPVPEDLAAPAREARLGERALAHHLPVALRQRAVAAALHRSSGRAPGAGRREAPRHRRARLLRRLPGDAGGARHGEPRASSSPTAASSSPTSPASTTASPACASSRPSCAAN